MLAIPLNVGFNPSSAFFIAAVVCKEESSSMAFNSEPEILGVVVGRKSQAIKNMVLLSWHTGVGQVTDWT